MFKASLVYTVIPSQPRSQSETNFQNLHKGLSPLRISKLKNSLGFIVSLLSPTQSGLNFDSLMGVWGARDTESNFYNVKSFLSGNKEHPQDSNVN